MNSILHCINDPWCCTVICPHLIPKYMVVLECHSVEILLVLKLWDSGSQAEMNLPGEGLAMSEGMLLNIYNQKESIPIILLSSCKCQPQKLEIFLDHYPSNFNVHVKQPRPQYKYRIRSQVLGGPEILHF